MAVKVTLDPTEGLVQTTVAAGSADALPQGFSPFRLPTTRLSTNTTLSADSGGVYAITSSTGGAKTITLPAASAAPGIMYVFRSLSADAHVITASNEVVKTKAISFGAPSGSTSSGTVGSRLAFPATIGCSAAMVGTGQGWLVLSVSGSVIVSET